MQADNFTVEDIKQGIYSGRIVERQHDPLISIKYCISGKAMNRRRIQLVCRITELGYLRIITVQRQTVCL
jgi:hypothetical protein